MLIWFENPVPIVKDIKLTKINPETLVHLLSLVEIIHIFAKENKLEEQKQIIKAFMSFQVKCQVKNNLNIPCQTENKACAVYILRSVSYVGILQK